MNKAILLVAALLIGWGDYDANTLAHDMRIRRDFVAGLNSSQEDSRNEVPMFATAGATDEIFVIACVDCSNGVDSDAALDYFEAQAPFVQMVREVGFTKISCGGHTREIRIPYTSRRVVYQPGNLWILPELRFVREAKECDVRQDRGKA